jgi:hypothetical protein
LRFRRGPIDFVGQQDVAEHGARLKDQLSAAFALGEDLRANNVGRQEVWRELDALKLDVKRFGKRVHKGRFAKAGNAFEQDMPAGDDRQEHVLDDLVLADNELADLAANPIECDDKPLDCFACLSFRYWHLGPRWLVPVATGE